MPSVWLGLLLGVVAVTSAAAPMTVERTAGNLRLEASVPARVFAAGAPIAMSLSVRNTGSVPVTVSFSSGQRYDVIARRPRGDEVWRWSHDKAFIQLVQTMLLRAGEELAYQVTWDQRDLQGRQVDPGAYELFAVFLGRSGGDRGQGITLPPLSITINP